MDVVEMGKLQADIMAGRWDSVLKVTRYLSLPSQLEFDLLSQVILDLIELGGDLYPAMQVFKRLKSKVGIELFNDIADLERVCGHAAEHYGKS